MSAKASLSLGSAKGFCIEHMEKFAFAGVMVTVLLFAYRAVVGTVPPPCTPEELSSAASDAEAAWERTDPSAYLSGLERPLQVADFGKKILSLKTGIEADPYLFVTPFNQPDFPQLNKRDEPKLLAVRDLRASGGIGTFSVSGGRDPSGRATGSRQQGKRWVAVVGLLPIQEQIQGFEDTFQDAQYKNPETDLPRYIHYYIQRAEVEVGASDDPATLAWKDLGDPRNLLRDWAVGFGKMAPAVVHGKYMHPPMRSTLMPMASPLGPLLNEPWDAQVAHAPEIPLLFDMSEAARRGLPEGEEGEELAEGENAEGERPGGFEGLDGPQRGTGLPGVGRGGQGETYAPGAAMPADTTMMDPNYGSEMAGGGEDYNMAGSTYPGQMGGRVEEEIEYQLFRFFDFDVKPGTRYRYRVRLLLANPNYKVEPRFLAKDTLGKKSFLEAEWSDPTETVTVPRDSRLLAGPVKSPSSWRARPAAQIVAITYRMDDGLKATGEFTVVRGQLANIEGTVREEAATSRYGEMDGMMSPDYGGAESGMEGGMFPGLEEAAPSPRTRRRDDDDDEEAEKILHNTEMLVVDLSGGTRLHRSDRSLTAPGHMLLLDPDGNLVVTDELTNQEEFALHKEPEEEKRPRGGARDERSPDTMEMMYE